MTVPEVGPAEVHQRRERGELAILLDVREPAEWEQGHVPGAVHVPRGLLEWKVDPTYANHEPQLVGRTDAAIVIMCATGGRSLLAAKTLREMGYRDVASMAGGYVEWARQGLPIEDGGSR